MNETEEELDRLDMARLAQGGDGALDNLMARHARRLFHYLLRQLNESDAEDCAQEAFVRVYLNRAKFRPGAKFPTWLYTIATNLAHDCQRRKARRPEVSMDAEDAEGRTRIEKIAGTDVPPSETMAAGERAARVKAAVGALPGELRTALILFEYENLSQAEIAVVLNCTPKAVETRIYRAKKLLRESLAELAA